LTERIDAGEVDWGPLREGAVRLVLCIGKFRERLEKVVSEQLPDEYAAILNGMLVGDTGALASGTRDTFRRSGVMHLFAVSGFHTSLWTMLLYKLLLRLGAGKKTSSGLCLLFLLFFVVLTGFARSAIRAAVMLGVFFLCRMLLRSPDPLASLGLAALAVVLPNPFYGGDAGVLLSYFATLGILSLYPPVMKDLRDHFLKERIHNYRRRKRIDGVLSLLLIALCTSLMTLPVVTMTFENISLVTLVSNLLLTAAASQAILLTGAGALFGLIPGLSLLTPWCGLAGGVLARYMLRICAKLSDLPFAYVTLTGKGFLLGLVAALLVAVAGFVLYGSLPERGLVRVTALLSAIVLLGSVLTDTAFDRNVVHVTFADVGGTCIVVTFRHAAYIIGAGGDDYQTPLRVDDILSRASVTKLAALVVPRSKKTESAALEALLEEWEPEVLLKPEDLPDTPLQTVSLAPDISLKLYRQEGDDCAGLLTVQGVDLLLLFRPTVDLDRLPSEARSAPVCFLRGKRSGDLKLTPSSYIIVSGESGEVEARARNGKFRLYRACIAAK
ncbi:MAG: ComEC/Rec2 family competence protein, partial [Clostridia bacterium]|nr:ComEC/Rec2 family competence protein [Clostridia bacterium]